MKLSSLEKDLEMMEETLNRMKALTKEVEAMDDQVDHVRVDLDIENKPISDTPEKTW